MLKIVNFGCNAAVGLLEVLEVGHIIVYVKQGHKFVMLGAEFVELTLYFTDIALHLYFECNCAIWSDRQSVWVEGITPELSSYCAASLIKLEDGMLLSGRR